MDTVGVWAQKGKGFLKKVKLLSRTLGLLLHGYLIVFGFIGFFALLSVIPAFRINTFSITGNTAIETDIVISTIEEVLSPPFAFFIERDIPLWAPQERLAAAIYALDPRIRDVSVKGRFSRTMSVEIIEEEPAMLWCGSDVPTTTPHTTTDCWFANREGVIYARAPEYLDAPYIKYFTTPVPIFSPAFPRTHEYPAGYVIADETTMNRLALFFDALPERGYRATDLGVTVDADVVVYTAEGTRFLFGLSRDIPEDMKRLEALQQALRVKGDETPLSQVDLRFETKIYYQ